MKRASTVLVSLFSCFVLAVAAQAATITLNDRSNCNTTGGSEPESNCYFSGTVHFSSDPGSLWAVQCFVEESLGGMQIGGFSESGNDRGYADCCDWEARFQGTGDYQTDDVAITNLEVHLASGYKDWTP